MITNTNKQHQHNLQFTPFHDHFIQGHILKFIKKNKHHQDKGIICFPQQTYGNAEQSPEYFKNNHTLIPKNGYIYKHQNKPQFKYYSQKRYFSIDGSTNQQQSKLIHLQDSQNKLKFHRKKGKLTQFMDKNGWMNKTTKLMGFQRDNRARNFSNKDRSKRIQSLKQKINYQNASAKKPDTSGDYFKTIGSLTSKKLKIRAERNDQAQKFSLSIQPRNIQSSHRPVSTLERQSMQNKMIQTARDWSPSKLIKNKYEEFNKSARSNRLNKFANEVNQQRNSRQYSWRQNHQQTLEDWYRTTCSSKWVYTKKMQSQQTEQQA